MMLSRESCAAVIDLIENRLSVMHIGDQDDLRDVVALKRALAELNAEHGGLTSMSIGAMQNFGEIPRRGRRRKVGGTMGDAGRL